MYKNLKDQLMKAEAESRFIIAINIDIRGFTDFCRRSNTSEVALFIQTIYLKIINEYFPDLEFCKPTGDGMLIVMPYKKASFIERINFVVNKCVDLLNSFNSFCNNDQSIYFSVPDRIGIGISRGDACCIKSNGCIIDYSGQVLNIASRLMDITRPKGIIIQDNFDINVLDEYTRGLFESDKVYLQGVAEKEPISVYYHKDSVIINTLNKAPMGIYKWVEQRRMLHPKDIPYSVKYYSITLKNTPYSENAIVVELYYPDKITGTKGNISIVLAKERYKIEKIGDAYKIKVSKEIIKELLENEELSEDDVFTTKITYPIKHIQNNTV